MDRPNYYILLELDEHERDQEKIEQAIKSAQADWSRDSNRPGKAIEAKRKLELLSDIRKHLLDPVLREEQARECARIRQTKMIAATKDLDNHIELIANKGYLLRSEVARLVKKFSGFTEVEIKKRIVVEIRPDPKIKATPLLEPSLAKNIRIQLAIANVKAAESERAPSLYDFLGLHPGRDKCSLSDLMERARSLDAEIRRVNVKDAATTARQELAGFCLSIFKSEDSRDRYDNTVERQAIEPIQPLLEEAMADGHLDENDMKVLLREAGKHFVKPEVAEKYIHEVAAAKGISNAARVSTVLLRCGNCGIPNPSESSMCGRCGHPLLEECPRCATRFTSANDACTKCGLTKDDASQVRRLVRTAELALADGDVATAEKDIKKARTYWPVSKHWRDSEQVADVDKRVQHFKQQESERLQRAENLTAEIEKAIQNLAYYKAEELLAALRKLLSASPRIAEFEVKIQPVLRRARELVAQAIACESRNDDEEAIKCYRESLATCKDLPAAVTGLKKHEDREQELLSAAIAGLRKAIDKDDGEELLRLWEAYHDRLPKEFDSKAVEKQVKLWRHRKAARKKFDSLVKHARSEELILKAFDCLDERDCGEADHVLLQIAEQRSDCLQELRNPEPSAAPEDKDRHVKSCWERDREIWGESKLALSELAVECREDYNKARERLGLWQKVTSAIDAKDAASLRKLLPHKGTSPIAEYRCYQHRKVEITDLLAESSRMDDLLHAVQSEDEKQFLQNFDVEFLRQNPSIFQKHADQLEKLVRKCVLARAKLAREETEWEAGPANGSLLIHWVWPPSDQVSHCRLASRGDGFARRPLDRETKKVRLEQLRHTRGGAVARFGHEWEKLYVTVWPMIDLTWQEIAGEPLEIGPIDLSATSRQPSG